MSTITVGVDLNKYPTLARFSNDDAFIRVLIGPAGSLKTTYCFYEILRRACLQQPDAQGVRYTRWVVVRNTFEVLKRATMATAKNAIPETLLRYTEGNSPSAKGRFSLSDGTQVDMQIDFLAVDTVDVLGKVLGYDFTGGVLDEVSELEEEIMFAIARRAGRYPPSNIAPCTWSGAFGATNGPIKTHWLYKWYQGGTEEFNKIRATIERESGRKFFTLHQQPPALLRPDSEHDEWRPNPLAENVQNLPCKYNYYFNMLGGDEQKIAAYVEGKFANLSLGRVVFPEFSRDRNVIAKDKIPPLNGHPVVLGADFGRTPAVLLGAETPDGTLVIIKEIVGTDMSVDKLFDDYVLPVMTSDYRRSKIYDAWGDPAGSVGGQATEASPFSIIQSKGIPIRAATTNNQLGVRLDAVRWFLERTGPRGRPKLLVSDECTYLINAMAEGYVFEEARGNGKIGQDIPTKSHVDWVSDICDALQYLCLGIRLRGEPGRNKPKQHRNRGVIV